MATFNAVLSRFDVKKVTGNRADCVCPNHKDNKASLHITDGEDKILVHCKACGQDQTENILGRVGLEIKDLFKDNKPFERTWKENLEQFMGKKIKDYYHYTDDNGVYTYSKVRFVDKDFRFGVINTDKTYFDMKAVPKHTNGKRIPLLYNVKSLLDSNINTTVYYVEGEKDVHTLKDMGLLAVTAGGANDWRKAFSSYFKDRTVIVVADNDEPGQELSKKVATHIKGIATEITVITPSPQEHGDITDFFEHGFTMQDLEKIIEEAKRSTKEEGTNADHEQEQGAKPVFVDDKGKIIPYQLSSYIANKHSILSDKQTMYAYHDGIYSAVEPNVFKYIDDEVADKRQIKMNLINEVTSLVNCMTYTDEVEQTRGYIKFNNGLYDIHKGQFIDDDKSIIMFGQVPYNYNEKLSNIDETKFKEFVLSSLSEDMLPVVQELLGVCLYPITDKRAYFYILFGEGRNGKGVLADIISHMVPKELTSNIPLDGYDTRFVNSTIKGKTLNICLDDKTTRINEMGNIKTVSAGEPIFVEKKGKDGLSICPILTHVSLFNKLPGMNEKAPAFFDRLIPIEFKTTFGTAEEVARGEKDQVGNPKLKSYILENEMEYIIAWAIEGVKRVIDNNYTFTINNSLRDSKEAYRNSVDSVREWALSELTPLEGKWTNKDMTSVKVLYSRYLEWCDSEHITSPSGRNSFIQSMKSTFKKYHKEVNRQHLFAIFNE